MGIAKSLGCLCCQDLQTGVVQWSHQKPGWCFYTSPPPSICVKQKVKEKALTFTKHLPCVRSLKHTTSSQAVRPDEETGSKRKQGLSQVAEQRLKPRPFWHQESSNSSWFSKLNLCCTVKCSTICHSFSDWILSIFPKRNGHAFKAVTDTQLCIHWELNQCIVLT